MTDLKHTKKQLIQKQLRCASRAITQLIDRGFQIREINIYGGKPRIRLFSTPQCELLNAVERSRITDNFGTRITMAAVQYGCQVEYTAGSAS